ncbi:MAG: hypothetical protein N3G80_02760 [Candidatus Micrarchaeota archaeon]|nr:hypothetical protein [Candidatus Micrarchaeota archaeon]
MQCTGTPAVCTVSSTAAPICGASSKAELIWLAALAALATAILIALVYMAGEIMQNPRLLTWAKTESSQIFASIIIVGAVIGMIELFCSIQIGEVASIFTPLPKIFQPYKEKSIYDGAIIYLEKLMDIARSNFQGLRYLAGAYEIRISYTKMVCKGNCFISLVGYNEAEHGGETLHLALINNLLNSATISYLTAAFEYFTLQYILNGLFLVLLPIAIILRSLPFMRQFAGTIVAICISLYIMYPAMLVFNASIVPGVAPPSLLFSSCTCAGVDIFAYENGRATVGCKGRANECYDEEALARAGLEMAGFGASPRLPHVPNSIDGDVKANALIFIITVFFAAFNFIVIVAFARGMARLLGEEVDISKLGQMI